jgi:PKD repeat protein/glucose/arabinose dehydrogenase
MRATGLFKATGTIYFVVALFMFVVEGRAQTLPSGFSDALVMDGWVSAQGVVWDSNGRAYVWEKKGKVWIIENGVRLATPLVNIEQEVGNWGDHGLLGFALDPQFASNGRVYLMYVVDRHHLLYFGTPDYNPFATEGNAAAIVRIARYTAIGPGYNAVDPASRSLLLGETITTGAPIVYNTHGAGTLLFARDGTLLATIGDGASAASIDNGNAGESYFAQALADGIIRPAENVGAFRSQMVNCFNGKVLRMDPSTGDGIPSNPFFDPAQPRAPKSRVWAMGLRNPYRMTLKPGTGSTDPAAGDVGTLFIGDVGLTTWEETNVCTGPGMNFGWPIFEGFEAHPGYSADITSNLDMPNPLYDGFGCTTQYFNFQELLKQDSPEHVDAHPNPCNANEQVPNSVPVFFHARPSVDWLHGNRSRCGAFSGSDPVTFDLDDPGSPVVGPRFGGYAAIGGPWSNWNGFPAQYRNSAYHADYAGGWIKRFVYNANDSVVSVHDFAEGLGAINWVGQGPDGCLWYSKYNSSAIRRICNTQTVNLPPVAMAAQSAQYGPGPLSVNFSSVGSTDPENGPLNYLWDFGDGSPTSGAPNPTHVFTSPPGVPTTYLVTLVVTDNIGQQTTQELMVSVNNTPPNVAITSFADGGFYPVGVDTTYLLAAFVSDAEHSPAELTHTWRTVFHHNTHEHPGPWVTAVASQTVISGEGCDGETYWYTVELTVTDGAGLSTTVQHALYPRCQSIAPTAIIQVSATAGLSPFAVNFNGSQSHDPGSIVSYFWEFGDGTTSTAIAPLKVFSDIGDRTVSLTVTDNDGLIGTATRTISVLSQAAPQCMGASGGLLHEHFAGISGASLLDLLNAPSYPHAPSATSQLSSFQGPTNQGSNFGTRVRGYIVAPTTGNYVFTLTADDAAAVYLSLNAEPRFSRLICTVPTATGATQYNAYASQVSAAIALEAGRYYYVELAHKEGAGADHFALRWQTPTNPSLAIIPGSVLVAWQDCMPGVRVRTNLSGPFSATEGLMRDDLRAAGFVPLTEPYTALGFAHAGGGGGEATTAGRLATTGLNAPVDWVVVELRSGSNPAQVLATRCALVERDGDVVGVDGYPVLLFNVADGAYFVSIRHRNHLGAMSSVPLMLTDGSGEADFTSATFATWGTNAQRDLASGKRGLWNGNANGDGALRYVGGTNDRDPILVAIGGSTPTNTVTGYRRVDTNMDGVTRYIGANNDRDPILFNIGGSIPTNVRSQQLP